jgi:hypothetical protein
MSNPKPSTSRKRKAEASSLPLQRKRSPNAISVTPVSAFAAARAKIQSTNQGSAVRERELEDSSESVSKGHPHSVRDARLQLEKELMEQAQLAGAHHARAPEPDEYWDPGLDCHSDDSIGNNKAQPGQEPSVPAPKPPLSTWKPTSSNIISRSPTSERLLMTHGQSLAVFGQYDLKVHAGLVSFSGAILTQMSQKKEIYTTGLNALPSIKCISSGGAEIEVFHLPSSRRTLQSLERLSPLFSNILPQTSAASSFVKVFLL